MAHDPRYALVVVGGGPEEQRLRTLLPGATFLGVLHGEELGAAYASLDVFVHTGRHETYCQSAQEALASGVPVVAPRAGGPVDVVPDGVAGFLYRPGDAQTWRRTSTSSLPTRCSGAGWAWPRGAASRGRSWHSVNLALIEHYRDVISAPAGLVAVAWPADPTRRSPRPHEAALRRCRRGAHGAPSGGRGQGPEQRPGGEGLGPVRRADQHHRRDRGLVGVVVLAGVLEHLLHGAAGAGQEDDPGVADLQQDASRVALRKYFAMAVANRFGGSWP